ncbi:MAG: hypothetical protein PHG71_04065, partial [Kiritimatiellae bacterium]|nr:hypothetical protein [Kiritimatiellia bacterium]
MKILCACPNVTEGAAAKAPAPAKKVLRETMMSFISDYLLSVELIIMPMRFPTHPCFFNYSLSCAVLSTAVDLSA